MKRFVALLTISLLSLSAQAQMDDDDKGLSSRWFKVLPEAQSLQSFGVAASHELPLSIRALVWNIKKSEMLNWKKEFTQYGQDKDLFVLQEAYETDDFSETIAGFTGAQWDMGVSFLYRRYADAATGTMVGSKAHPKEVFVKHSIDREPVIGTPKALTFAKYDLAQKDDDLLVISVHAINFETTGAFKRQMDQIEEELKRHQGPVLLAGDFNTWNATRTNYLFNLAKRHQLAASEYVNETSRMRFRGWPLDHIFTRGAVVKSAEVVKDSQGSDHKPFLVEMEISP